uniref:SPK domain-containing protein n=1 Tax=Caenorhabditis tropicalis TaxID=1561998 RepID=A0A1I7V4N3_9PELO
MQTVADRISEPFNSEDLKEWCPLIKSLLTSKQLNLRESGAQLWKKSFGTVKTQLTYPDDLRTILQKMPKKFGIVVPPAARLDSTSFLVDDDAMDGLSDSSESSMLMNLETNKMQNDLGGNQCSFQFSQQGPADDVADKLLKEKSVRTCTPSRNPVSHDKNSSRKRAAKISLLDEDSCDFVKIASTPPSCRKTRLTDRQKEKLAEASVPNTSINYMGEESQSGLQKTENIKKALTAMNFDVGEDSISTQFSIALQKTTADATDIEKEESAQSCRKSSKRSRKLFNVTPVKAFPDVSSYNSGSCNSVDEKKRR